ncbi:chromosome partitioning protein ParB, partial [Vibrio parahaemolyticus]
KALAKQLQTAKEHNQREIGLQCQLIMNNGDYRQEDVAQILGISRQAVGRALKAASIDSKLIQLFPVVNELSHTDYAILGKVMKVFDSDSKGLNSLIRKIEKHADNAQAEQSQEDRKESLISVIKAELKIVEAKLESDKAEVTSLAQFDSKGMFARKRVKGRNFSYEFGRLSKSVQEALDVAIAQVLEKHK